MTNYSDYTDKELVKVLELAMHEELAMCQFIGERANLVLECLHRLMRDKALGIRSRQFKTEEMD